MHALWLILFSIAAGFTASGIIANLYRVSGFRASSTGGRIFHAAVFVFAGPNVLFGSAMRGRLQKKWQPLWFWFTTALVAYWSLALGFLVLELAIQF
jgi:hypothetical protein